MMNGSRRKCSMPKFPEEELRELKASHAAIMNLLKSMGSRT
jgi:hypothetical protein